MRIAFLLELPIGFTGRLIASGDQALFTASSLGVAEILIDEKEFHLISEIGNDWPFKAIEAMRRSVYVFAQTSKYILTLSNRGQWQLWE